MAEDYLQVRNGIVNFYVLKDIEGLYLIDAGFLGGLAALEKALLSQGWEKEPILGILVTHGHLDHILNVGKLAAGRGAWITAPELDLPHYQGKPCYKGASRAIGVLETIGRSLLGFRPFIPDRLLNDGDFLDVWHGLKAIHLPGHTAGHMGYYCEKIGLLFSADLFASYRGFSHLPPVFFNSGSDEIPASIAKALELGASGVLPNHADDASAVEHLERLRGMR